VAQGVGPEFKPQYQKKRKRKKRERQAKWLVRILTSQGPDFTLPHSKKKKKKTQRHTHKIHKS
jgi:hypothetical protein